MVTWPETGRLGHGRQAGEPPGDGGRLMGVAAEDERRAVGQPRP
jgi:hypothetical protein